MPTLKECDLVLKGGITSGVVYPKLITTLAQSYKFVNIGGTSVGAIGAGFCAAAEFSRQNGKGTDGFEVLEEIADVIGKNMSDLFQPDKKYKKLFKSSVKHFAKGKDASFVWYLLRNVFRILGLKKNLPNSYYGVCRGLTVKGYKFPGLTDWMNLWLERSAGTLSDQGELPDTPLTFGMLRQHKIELRTITTNLSEKTPVTLPELGNYWIKRKDLKALFPSNIVSYIESKQPDGDVTSQSQDAEAFLKIPDQDDLPVLFGMRLSLSFPVLLAAVPLYTNDWSLRHCEEKKKALQQCWFSDGGISSNFPIHLFDNVLPTRPTFGISLGEFHDCRQDKDVDEKPGINRIYLPMGPNQGKTVSINPIKNLLDFAWSILDSAKDWQDLNQMLLPGYSERVARVYLKEDEGGLNLSMSQQQINSLTRIGQLAGHKLLDDFNFEEHRWRRVLSSYSAIEQGLEAINQNYNPATRQFLQDVVAGIENGAPIVDSYKPKNADEVRDLIARLDKLAEIAQLLADTPIRESWGQNGNMPKPAASLRIVPTKLVT